MKLFHKVYFLVQEQNVCGKTLPEYKRKYTYLGTYDEEPNCPDGSDELCGDHCVPDDFTGRFTFKVCKHVLMDIQLPIWFKKQSPRRRLGLPQTKPDVRGLG